MTDFKTPQPAPQAHDLKTDPEVFAAVLSGAKTFEIRFNDRDFKVGDKLRLRETTWTGAEMRAGAVLNYTGREVTKTVSHILSGYGLADGWCCLSFAPEIPAPEGGLTLRAAALQALDTLEHLQGGCTDSDDGTVEAVTVWCPEVIGALRAALAAQPTEVAQRENEAFELGYQHGRQQERQLQEARQALAEGDPEACFKVVKGELCYRSRDDDQSFGMWVPVTPDDDLGFANGTVFVTSQPQPKGAAEEHILPGTMQRIQDAADALGRLLAGIEVGANEHARVLSRLRAVQSVYWAGDPSTQDYASAQAPAPAPAAPEGFSVVKLSQCAYRTPRGAIYGGTSSKAGETPLFEILEVHESSPAATVLADAQAPAVKAEPLTGQEMRRAFEADYRKRHDSRLYCESEWRGWQAGVAACISGAALSKPPVQPTGGE